jgi:hypothetical protein
MKNLLKWIKNNPNRAMFLVPILLVAGISISHVVTWYDMANPMSWAIYLSIAIEVGAITALVAATNRIKGGIWFMFGIVTFIQMIGNIFFSYKEIDANGELFKSWVELTGPLWELMGTDITDVVGMKRWLAFLEGGLLPVISLTSLHFFVKYEDPNSPKETDNSPREEVLDTNIEKKDETISPKNKRIPLKGDEINDDRIEHLINLQKEADMVWENVKKLKEEGKLPNYDEELDDELPGALANSEYRLEETPIELTEEDAEVLFKGIDEPESPNEVLQNALKKYKESRNEGNILNQPVKSGKTNIKRID